MGQTMGSENTFRKQVEAASLALPLYGGIVTKMYREQWLGRPRMDPAGMSDFVKIEIDVAEEPMH
ncbi:hypothetical protein BaRGS_00017723, partial [Batillaria attramentaria]